MRHRLYGLSPQANGEWLSSNSGNAGIYVNNKVSEPEVSVVSPVYNRIVKRMYVTVYDPEVRNGVISAVLWNNMSTDIEADIFAAAYDDEDNIVKVDKITETIPSNGQYDYETNGFTDGSKYRLFIWKANDMIPFSDCINVPIK